MKAFLDTSALLKSDNCYYFTSDKLLQTLLNKENLSIIAFDDQ